MSTPNLVRPRPPRVPFVRPVQVSRADGSAAQWLLASNLSEGGMFVRAAEPPPVGTKVRLELEARGQNLSFAEGEVIWSRPMDLSRLNQGLPGFGLRFGELAPESKALVRRLVDEGGTGRGQAKTQAYTSPASLKLPLREPLHAPASPLVEHLVPSDKATTGEYATIPPLPSREEPLLLGAVPISPREPTLDPASLRQPMAPGDEALEQAFYVRPHKNGPGSVVAGLLLCAAVVGAGIFALRGFHEAAALPSEFASPAAPAPVALAEPLPPAPAASPAPAPAPVVAAPLPAPRAEPVAKVEKPAHTRPSVPAAHAAPVVVAAQHEASAIALPSGAATAVQVAESSARLEITAALAPGASIEKVFALSGPERLVIDLKGSTPRGTPRVEGRSGVTAIRLGARQGGTRLVLDLARRAGKVHTDGATISVDLR